MTVINVLTVECLYDQSVIHNLAKRHGNANIQEWSVRRNTLTRTEIAPT